MLLSCHRNVGEYHDIILAERESLNRSQEFRYLGTTVTDQNLIQEEIKNTQNSASACYHWVQNRQPCGLLYKNAKLELTRL
jgi:hypothetical protein